VKDAAFSIVNGFDDRHDAGRQLAAELLRLAPQHPIVLALPRGGVPVGYEIAHALGAPLDIWVVRKLGVPWHPELGAGAVAENGDIYINQSVVDEVGLSERQLHALIADKRREVDARVKLLRGSRARPDLRGRTVILVDDGVATGGTVRAAIRSIRAQGPRAIVLAVPVAAPQTLRVLRSEVDRVLCLRAPADLWAIGVWYEDFSQISDEEVIGLLDRADREAHASA
jgi:putative phosphoribosyl transferase